MSEPLSIAIEDMVACSDADFPLKSGQILLNLEFASSEVPEAARPRYYAQLLRTFADRLEEGKGTILELEAGESRPGELDSEAELWRVPTDLHMKSAKAAHRFLVAVANLETRGPAPTLSEVARLAGLSMPPVYRFLDAKTDAGAYLESLVSASKRGRAKVIDLTPLGRKVASRIRAGALPS